MALPPLESFGQRIMICGTSNTGKSTLAKAVGGKLDLPVVYLDQLRFKPHTHWEQRPDDEFVSLHDAAIEGDRWVIDGNYSPVMRQRLVRATGIIMLSDHRWANFARYLRRTLFEPDRAGGLDGTRDRVTWDMTHWVLVRAPRNVRQYREILPARGLPFVELRSMRELRAAHAEWGLTRSL